MAKLSPTMLDALVRIRVKGGKAIAEGGGTWMSADGQRLKVEPRNGSIVDRVVTRTIYALEDRGMLARTNEDDRFWRDTRQITQEGRETADRAIGDAADAYFDTLTQANSGGDF